MNRCYSIWRFVFISLIFLAKNTLLYANESTDLPVADLEVSVQKIPDGMTPSGTGGIITFTITNHGPDSVGRIMPEDPYGTRAGIRVVSGSMYLYLPGGLPLLLDFDPDQSCGLTLDHADTLPPIDAIFTWSIFPGAIKVNETVVCSFHYIIDDVSQFQTYYFDLDWTLFLLPNVGTDPNPGNNVAHSRFQFAPSPTPVPALSIGSYLLLVVLLVIAGMYSRLTRRSTWTSNLR